MCNYCKNVAQPIQTWVLIRKVAEECHNALILPRSANKFNERNPIPIGLRKTPVGDAEGDMRGA